MRLLLKNQVKTNGPKYSMMMRESEEFSQEDLADSADSESEASQQSYNARSRDLETQNVLKERRFQRDFGIYKSVIKKVISSQKKDFNHWSIGGSKRPLKKALFKLIEEDSD